MSRVAWGITAALVVATAWLSLVAAGPGTPRWDPWLARRVTRLDGPGWRFAADVSNLSGEWPVLIGVPLLAGLVLAARGRRVEATILVGVAVLRALNWPLKQLFQSPRPATLPDGSNDVATGLGYPSGHAMGVLMLSGAIVAITWRLSPGTGGRVVALALAVGACLLSGYGRVASGAHWPSDVLGGYLWGALLLIAALAVADRVARRRGEGFGPVTGPGGREP